MTTPEPSAVGSAKAAAPLSDAQKKTLLVAFRRVMLNGSLDEAYLSGIEDAEAHHGITTASPAPSATESESVDAARLRDRVVELEEQARKYRTVMVAAAEEIHAHWDAHCDKEGYGPANLMHRLEDGIASEYGYTAGSFAKQADRIAHLEDGLRWLKTFLGRHDPPGLPNALVQQVEKILVGKRRPP